MTVVDFIRQYLKVRVDISNDDLWNEIQSIAQQLGVDLNSVDEAYAQLIAEEVDKNASGLAVSEAANTSAITPTENGKKNGKKQASQPTQSQSVESLKPAVQNLKTAVADEAEAMVSVFDQKSSQVEDAVTSRIMARCKQINPNIISKVSQELQEYTNESASFRGQIGSIFDETFADLINIAP